METTNLFIYRLRDLRLQGRAGACSYEVVGLPLNPVQFIETCVTVDMQGLGPSCHPRHKFHFLCISVTLMTNENTSKMQILFRSRVSTVLYGFVLYLLFGIQCRSLEKMSLPGHL